ncbi:MAG TPA: SMI1/KNR4 family protein [Aggregatilineaceae bacterium]|nr:SMI1/KNR4 family protein [Aggregatilineaceae bacterium]
MTEYNWSEFLARFNRTILDYLEAGYDDYVPYDFPPEVIASGWMGFPGATEAQIAAAEARLNVKFPASYRSFLQISNGFRIPGNLVPRVFSIDEVKKFDSGGWDDDNPVPDSEYFVYGPEQDSVTIRYQYLKTALVISEMEEAGTAQFLLNPQVVFENGEWEAWEMAHWLPGANRYRSFWDLMQATYEVYLEILADCQGELSPKDPPDAVVKKLPHLLAKLDAQIDQYKFALTRDPIHQGTIDGLTFARDQIVKLQARAQDPKQLRTGLSLLAAELEKRHQDVARSKMQDPLAQFTALLTQGLDQMLDFLHQNEALEGFRQAASLIRQFLNE